MSKIEKITSYRTTDGKVFTSADGAKRHQSLLDLTALLDGESLRHASPRDVSEIILSNWHAIKGIVEGRDTAAGIGALIHQAIETDLNYPQIVGRVAPGPNLLLASLARRAVSPVNNMPTGSDCEISGDLQEYINNGNAIKNQDGTYSTQASQWKDRLTYDEFVAYFKREYLS